MGTTTKVRFPAQGFRRTGETGLLDAKRTHELIDGKVFQMAPESYDHARRVTRIADVFRRRVGELGLDWSAYIREGHPVRLSEYDESDPEIAILKGEPGRTPRPDDILLIVEVSRTTYHRDRGEKLQMYAAAGIPEYRVLRIDADAPRCSRSFERRRGRSTWRRLRRARRTTCESRRGRISAPLPSTHSSRDADSSQPVGALG
jgi:hypothetical protein